MSVANVERLANYIKDWLVENYRFYGSPYLIIPISGGINSSCAALLCKKANIPLIAIHINLNPDDDKIVTGFCLENNIQLIKINGSDIIGGIEAKVFNADSENKFYIYKKYLVNNFANMIASSVANIFGGTILSSFNKIKIELIKKINKLSDASDIYPFGDLYESEIKNIFIELTSNLPIEHYIYTKSIAEKNVKHEEIGLTVSGEELEWAYRENIKSRVFGNAGIIEAEESPPNHPSRFWIGYNSRQRDIISKLNGLDKNLKNKNYQFNICNVRNIEGMVS